MEQFRSKDVLHLTIKYKRNLLLQCVTLVEPSKSVLVFPGQVMQ